MPQWDAASEYRRVVARDAGLAVDAPLVDELVKAVTLFLPRLTEVLMTGNGSVTIHVESKRVKRVEWVQGTFVFTQ